MAYWVINPCEELCLINPWCPVCQSTLSFKRLKPFLVVTYSQNSKFLLLNHRVYFFSHFSFEGFVSQFNCLTTDIQEDISQIVESKWHSQAQYSFPGLIQLYNDWWHYLQQPLPITEWKFHGLLHYNVFFKLHFTELNITLAVSIRPNTPPLMPAMVNPALNLKTLQLGSWKQYNTMYYFKISREIRASKSNFVPKYNLDFMQKCVAYFGIIAIRAALAHASTAPTIILPADTLIGPEHMLQILLFATASTMWW